MKAIQMAARRSGLAGSDWQKQLARNPKLVSGWWSKNQSQLPPGVRHLCGKPISAAALSETLHSGRQRQRSAAALESALLNPSQPLYEVRAPGFQQQFPQSR